MENKKIIQEYFENFSATSTAELFRRYIAEHNIALRSHVEVFRAGMPDYSLEPVDIIAEGNKVVARFTLQGTHTGDLMGIPATGKVIKLNGIIIYEMENGKIANQWMEADMSAFMQQLQPASVNEKMHSN
jgi:steroid delta-isomerase-like uncharacterized protein